jgi:hypothetical protein
MIAKASLPKDLQGAIESFDAWVDAKLESQQDADQVKQTLYQYTTAEGLKGIFETEQLWFTDYRYLNDPEEFRYGKKLALEAVNTAKSNSHDSHVSFFLKTVCDILSDDNLESVLYVFLASFTRKRNDLNLWRAYGDDGKGFAIGFAPEMFKLEDCALKKDIEKIFLGSVVYDRQGAISRNLQAIDQASQVFFEAVEANFDLMKDREVGLRFMRELRTSLIASPLIWYSLTTKHHAYSDEDEVRQVILSSGDDLKPHVQTRVRGSEIVPYVAAPWRVRRKGMIAEIVVGPAASLGAEEAVIAMLRYYGVDGVKVTCSRSCGVDGVKVTRSKIPYRPV